MKNPMKRMKNPMKKAAGKVGDTARKARSVLSKSNNTGSGPLGERTKKELYERARELDIDGRSKMSKKQLVGAIRSRG